MKRPIQPKAWEEASRFVIANKRHCNASAQELHAATIKIAQVLSDLMNVQVRARNRLAKEKVKDERYL
jgi:uncharacterized membrane protein